MGHARLLYADYRKATPVSETGAHQIPATAIPRTEVPYHTPQANIAARHPEVQRIVRHFSNAHLPVHLQEVSAEFRTLVFRLLPLLPDGAELIDALKKLRDAKDAAVRAAVEHHDQ